ncbi:MAG: cytochrome c family protein, partial [Pseudomonadota bacterium]
EQNRVGPHLVGIVGRPVGSIDGYKYSSAMTGWGEGKTWTVEQLTEYLADPKGVVPGTKMAYRGVKKEADLANLIAYLEAPGS